MKVILFTMIILFSVWSLAYGEQIVQVTHGWCSPAVANVKGDVYIKCIGVSPNAHKKLNEELRKLKRDSKLKIQDLVAQADNWARKYHELTFQVAQLNNSSDKIKKISRLILDGDLDAAASQLDSAISQQEQQIGYLAELHYLRAYTYSFEFNMPETLKHNELAYRYAQSNPKYIVSYARALFDNGQLVTSETLLNDNLPKLLTLVRHGSIQDYMYVATALDTLGAITASMRRTDVSFLSEFVSEFLNASKNMNSKTNDQKEFKILYAVLSSLLGRDALRRGETSHAEQLFTQSWDLFIDLCRTYDAGYCHGAVDSMAMLATIDTYKKNYQRAIQRYKVGLDIVKAMEPLKEAEPQRVSAKAVLLVGIAETYLAIGQKTNAIQYYKTVVGEWEKGDFHNDLSFVIVVTHSYQRLAMYRIGEKAYSDAIEYLDKSRKLTTDGPFHELEVVRISKARTLLGFAYANIGMTDFRTANRYSKDSMIIIEKYWKNNPDEYKLDYSQNLYALGFSNIVIGIPKKGCTQLSRAKEIDPTGHWGEASFRMKTKLCN